MPLMMGQAQRNQLALSGYPLNLSRNPKITRLYQFIVQMFVAETVAPATGAPWLSDMLPLTVKNGGRDTSISLVVLELRSPIINLCFNNGWA